MARAQHVSLTWTLLLACWLSFIGVVASVDPSPNGWGSNISHGIGPDGPWAPINFRLGSPFQTVLAYPTRGKATVAISGSVCQNEANNCSYPRLLFYNGGPQDILQNATMDISTDEVPGWDQNITAPLVASGAVTQFLGNISHYGMNSGFQRMNNTYMLLSEGLKTKYPNGITTAIQAGFFSLTNTSHDFSLPTGGSTTAVSPLAWLTTQNTRPNSPTWGFHQGSVKYKIAGTLRMGSYPQARVLTEPGVFDDAAFPLTNLSINSTIPDFASSDNMLSASGVPKSGIRTILEPSLPYMYLPAEVCTSLAAQLPVIYNPGLQLYLWNTSHPSLKALLTSLSSLQFTFTNSSGIHTNIAIPLALLNLTLTPPLVPEPTPYFPCRPYTPPTSKPASGLSTAATPYFLGRAILQGAFIGQNWATQKHFLAQAPGPLIPGNPYNDVLLIDSDAETLTPYYPPTRWEDTWKGTLSLRGLGRGNDSLPAPASQSTHAGGTNLSTSTKIAIAVGASVGGSLAIALVLLGVYLIIRRRRAKKTEANKDDKNFDILDGQSKPVEKMIDESDQSRDSSRMGGIYGLEKAELRGDHWKNEAEADSNVRPVGLFELAADGSVDGDDAGTEENKPSPVSSPSDSRSSSGRDSARHSPEVSPIDTEQIGLAVS